MSTLYTYEAFDDRYTVIISPTKETHLSPNDTGNEVECITIGNIAIALDYENDHPNTVWSVIHGESLMDSDITEDSDDEVEDDDSNPDLIDIHDDGTFTDTYYIIPGIEEIDVIFYLVTKEPYDEDDISHSTFVFDM